MSSLYLREDLRDTPHDVRSVVSLHGDEQKHAVKVNRIRVGEETSIGDGRGLMVRGPVIAVSATVLSLAVTHVTDEEVPELTIWLVQALAKGDRDELAIQTATAASITLLGGSSAISRRQSLVQIERAVPGCPASRSKTCGSTAIFVPARVSSRRSASSTWSVK